MAFVEAFRKVNRHYLLVLYPIIFDLISLAISWSIVGFYGKAMVSIRLMLEMGFPSLSHLSNIPLFINSIDFLNIPLATPSNIWIVVVLMIMIGTFMQGGYISYLYSIVSSKTFHLSHFLSEGKRNWIQFIFLEIILFFGKISVTAFLVLFFGIIGVFASLVFFIVLRVIFIYLEFTMVVDRMSIASAMKRCRSYLKKSLLPTLGIIAVMYAVSGGISLLLHKFWAPFVIIGLVFVYAYIMSVIQIVFMLTLCRTKKELN